MDCKIADFGLSKMQDLGEMTHSLGCLPYQSPEVFKGETYTKLADIYSFGCVLYELFSGFGIFFKSNYHFILIFFF